MADSEGFKSQIDSDKLKRVPSNLALTSENLALLNSSNSTDSIARGKVVALTEFTSEMIDSLHDSYLKLLFSSPQGCFHFGQ